MSRRRLLLEEMGIGPRWRLRNRTESDVAQTAPAQADARAEALPEAHTSRAEEAAGPAAASASASRADEAVSPAKTRRAVPAQPAEVAPSGRAEPKRTKAEPTPESESRRALIAQMDWSALKASVAQCLACPLHERRTQTVFGVGDERAEWVFVGEGPGAEEDMKGEPFVGQAGRLLDNMLAALGLARGKNVYIANVVKCRPPNNRNPEPREMNSCEPYLARQIALIQPKLIVALGKVASNQLLETDASIASLRGSIHDYRGIPLVVTYHPAYLLRSLPEKAKAWVDLCFARDTMAELQAEAGGGPTKSRKR